MARDSPGSSTRPWPSRPWLMNSVDGQEPINVQLIHSLTAVFRRPRTGWPSRPPTPPRASCPSPARCRPSAPPPARASKDALVDRHDFFFRRGRPLERPALALVGLPALLHLAVNSVSHISSSEQVGLPALLRPLRRPHRHDVCLCGPAAPPVPADAVSTVCTGGCSTGLRCCYCCCCHLRSTRGYSRARAAWTAHSVCALDESHMTLSRVNLRYLLTGVPRRPRMKVC